MANSVAKIETLEQRRGRKSSRVYKRDIVNDRANFAFDACNYLLSRRGELYEYVERCRIRVERCDSKEIQIPRNDLIHGRRTGIIITLLPISSETVETGDEEKRRNCQIGTKETGRRRKKEIEREREREEDKKRKEREHEEETRQGPRQTFRSRHPVYRSAVAGPMAWRSRQIIITNHQLFARNG